MSRKNDPIPPSKGFFPWDRLGDWMKESTTYQAIFAEGRLLGLREVLLELGTERFGPPDVATAAALEAITDQTRLLDLCGCVRAASSWQNLLGMPAAPTR